METYDPRLNQIIDDRFRLVRVLGEGGMGIVYEAVQLSIERPVALKMLRVDADEMVRHRMLRELRLLTKLNHPNIVNVLDGGETEYGDVFFVMEKLVGPTLADKLAHGRLPWRHACDIALQLCDALVASHALGIVHRDLKPSNIMLVHESERGELVKVLDFGIAKDVMSVGQRNSVETIVGTIVGTPHYMAPEAIGGELDPRSDLYALGCVLYEMLAGISPFGHASQESVLWHQLRESPPPLPADVPPPLAHLVMALLAKDPWARPASASTIRNALAMTTHVPAVVPTTEPWWPRVATPIAILLGLMIAAFAITMQCA